MAQSILTSIRCCNWLSKEIFDVSLSVWKKLLCSLPSVADPLFRSNPVANAFCIPPRNPHQSHEPNTPATHPIEIFFTASRVPAAYRPRATQDSSNNQSLPNNCNTRNLGMTEISTRVSPDGSPADLVARAVNMHLDGGGDCLQEHTAAPVPTIKELHASREAPNDRATSQNQASEARNSNYTAYAINPTQRHSPRVVAREPKLAHLTALRRLNGISSNRGATDSGETRSSSSTEPVLVRKYSNPTPEAASSKRAQMKKNRKSKMDPKYDLPPLESFSFQDILASIDPEVKASIDSIAEICGRSKMSLADEYSSHLPPQAEFITSHEEDVVNTIHTHLDTLHEASSLHSDLPRSHDHNRRNSASLALIATANHRNTVMPSVSTAATSMIHSEARPEFSSHEPSSVSNAQPDGQSSLLPHVIAWLRRSSASFPGSNESPDQVDRNTTATDALHRILTKSREPESVAQS